MCDCANCDGITLFAGTDGNGIVNTTYNSSTGMVTFYYSDGSTYTTGNLVGPAGPTGPAGPASECCTPVKYVEERLGAGTSGNSVFTALTNMNYTVPSGGAGVYELMFVADTQFSASVNTSMLVQLNVYKNGSAISANVAKQVQTYIVAEQAYIIPVSVLISNVTLAVGDVIDVRSSSTNPTQAYLNFGVMKINKLS